MPSVTLAQWHVVVPFFALNNLGISFLAICLQSSRGKTRALIGEESVFSIVLVLPDEFFLELGLFQSCIVLR